MTKRRCLKGNWKNTFADVEWWDILVWTISELPVRHEPAYMANGLGKLRGEKHNLTSRNSVSTKTPACIQLIKMQSQINVRRSRVWRVANVRACVWLCFHADRGKISPGMCSRAQSDDWSCEVGVELWQRRCQRRGARDLWAHPSPTAPFPVEGGRTGIKHHFQLSPPPSIIRFCVQIYYHPVCHFNMLRNAGTGLVLFFHWPFFDLGESIDAELCQKMGTDREENKAAQSGD